MRHKGKEFSGVIETPKHFLNFQIIILASAVKTFTGQAKYSDGLRQNRDDIQLIICKARLAFISHDAAWLTFIMSTPNLWEV